MVWLGVRSCATRLAEPGPGAERVVGQHVGGEHAPPLLDPHQALSGLDYVSPPVARCRAGAEIRPAVRATDERWAALEPLLEACRPKGKTPPRDLRRTVEAIVWRHANGAKWRAVPAELGPWWRAAQLFIRWAKLGVWPRLLEAAQARGVELGMAFLDGTSIRAHPKAAGAPKKGGPRASGTAARRSAARAAGSAPRPA